MNDTSNRSADPPFDIRVVSLYSRGVRDGIPKGAAEGNSFYAYSYYDAIEVAQAKNKGGPVLKAAYDLIESRGKTSLSNQLGSRQYLIAVVDVAGEENTTGPGYTANEIDTFWHRTEEAPLFFVSMINLKRADDLDAVLAGIGEVFPGGHHLVYLTFDHCDLILFAYGESFKDYTDRIFSLCYGRSPLLDDVITLYSFNPKCVKDIGEEFCALLRIGVQDYPRALKFRCAVESLGKRTGTNWLLGRNDISVSCETATLSWLASVREEMIRLETSNHQWYTTYDLTVFSPVNENLSGVSGDIIKRYARNGLHRKMKDRFQVFQDTYLDAYNRLEREGIKLTPNNVWLRWLEESCELVTSLMESRMSVDLATCLVPQFLGLLDYATKYFSEGDLKGNYEIQQIHESFSEFFSNIAILVDGMNQSNRQFVQVPAFHLPSFEIPPQILAYYTVLAQRLCEIFQDDKETIYSLTMAPKLVITLSVTSLAQQDVLPKHQWISMSMDEGAFYSLQLTTQTISHEISHFVGQGNRDRKRRKACMLRCAFHLLLVEGLKEYYKRVEQLLRDSFIEVPDLCCPILAPKKLHNIADRLLRCAICECGPMYDSDELIYSSDLEVLLAGLSEDILYNPLLAESFINGIFELAEMDSGCNALLMNAMRSWFCRLNGMSVQECPRAGTDLQSCLRERLHEILWSVLRYFTEIFETEPPAYLSESRYVPCQLLGKLPYMFSETFADLQSILLLKMSWEDYCWLLLRSSDRKLVADAPLRMLAVTRALIQNQYWTRDEISCKVSGQFAQVVKAVDIDTGDIGALEDLGFNSTYLYYLEDYLSGCAKKIQRSFQKKRHSLQISEIRDLYKKLSYDTPVIELQKTILLFIERYRSKLEKIEKI